MKWHACKVIKGKGRGKLLGFPTLNLHIPKNFNHQQGIYAGWVKINNQTYKGAFHYGPIDTFDDKNISLEVFVLDQNIEHQPVIVDIGLVERLRSTQKFSSANKLVEQIKKDVRQTKLVLRKSQEAGLES